MTEIKSTKTMDCECCGTSYDDALFIDGEYITLMPVEDDRRIYDYIFNQYKNGVMDFKIVSIKDKEYDYYTSVNEDLFVMGCISEYFLINISERLNLNSVYCEYTLGNAKL